LRDSDNKDYPVDVMAGSDYNAQHDKMLEMRPTKVYLLTEYPLAKIKFNYEPDTTYTAYFEFLKNFTEFSTTASGQYVLPRVQGVHGLQPRRKSC